MARPIQFAAFTITVLAVAAARGGTVIRVDRRARGPAPDGATWSKAFRHPQDAVDAALPGDEVWVAEGRYGPAGRAAVLRLAPGVRVFGGFAGTESLRDERDPARRRTVLDGERSAVHVVVAASASSLDGFVILGGRAAGRARGGRGGGIIASDVSEFEVEGCTFLGNAARYGGGIYLARTRGCAVRDCLFESNAGIEGGAVHLDGASPAIEGCDFKGNRADDGGAVYCAGAAPAVENCRFTGNVARYAGGAAFFDTGSRARVGGSDFRANSAEFGGAVYAWGAAPEFAGCDFTMNRASCEGGAVRLSASASVHGRQAGARAGGAGDARAAMTGCVFRGNRAAFGGGVSTSGSARAALVRCDFRGNEADYGGGGVHGTTPAAKGCTFAGNRVFGEVERGPFLPADTEVVASPPVRPGPGRGEIFITAAPR
ncbi:MAG: right-handed parallel beta-helix repeat-containing protein [Planctomycetota bacterium]|jgi:hypothetical protein